MSTNTATQAQGSTATATTATTEGAAPAVTTVTATSATPAAKKAKITDSIVATLRSLEEGQTMTISELSDKMGGVKRETLQATLSQMVKAKRVEKVVTGKRQPGYKAAK